MISVIKNNNYIFSRLISKRNRAAILLGRFYDMANLIYYGVLFFILVTPPLFLVIYSVNDEKHQGADGNIRSMHSSIYVQRNCPPYK